MKCTITQIEPDRWLAEGWGPVRKILAEGRTEEEAKRAFRSTAFNQMYQMMICNPG